MLRSPPGVAGFAPTCCRLRRAVVVVPLARPVAGAEPNRIGLSTASFETRREIIHVDEQREKAIMAGRERQPFGSVAEITATGGTAQRHPAGSLDQGVACDGGRGRRR